MSKDIVAVLVLGIYYGFLISCLMGLLYLIYKCEGRFKKFSDFLTAKE